MPPKRAPPPLTPLTAAERFLFFIAARIDTALRYRNANPGGDDRIYYTGLADEVVRRTTPLSVRFTEHESTTETDRRHVHQVP
jgi:hypothetical protein